MNRYVTITLSSEDYYFLFNNLNKPIDPTSNLNKTYKEKIATMFDTNVKLNIITDPVTRILKASVTLFDGTAHEITVSLITIENPVEIEWDRHKYIINVAKPEEINIYVEQRPVMVSYECPTCHHDIHINYDEFCSDNGDPPDWSAITCPKCGQKLSIESQDWN